MVLQRAPAQARVWGFCDSSNSNCQVTVTFFGQTLTATVTNTNWEVYLPATPAGGPYNVTATDNLSNTAELANVLFGDVFICSGQSNMQMTVSQSVNATENIIEAQNYQNIRIFTVGQGTASNTPLSEFATIVQTWSVASSATVGGPDWQFFSGVCWYFAKNLYVKEQIPLGMVSSNWGGTTVQQWSAPPVLSGCQVSPPSNAGELWNAMIVPLLPMSIKGTLWYQGESNVGAAKAYSCLFPAMIESWRTNFGQDFGFYFVMLAPWTNYPGDVTVPELRESQEAALALPEVGMAVATDLGDINSPYGNIHPMDKETVGYRLQLQALKLTYGRNVQADGPLFQSASSNPIREVTDDQYEISVNVFFHSETVGQYLTLVDNTCPSGAEGYCAGFELEVSNSAGATELLNGSVEISSSAVSIIVSAVVSDPSTVVTNIRYGWADWPVCTLYNSANLPAAPFFSGPLDA